MHQAVYCVQRRRYWRQRRGRPFGRRRAHRPALRGHQRTHRRQEGDLQGAPAGRWVIARAPVSETLCMALGRKRWRPRWAFPRRFRWPLGPPGDVAAGAPAGFLASAGEALADAPPNAVEVAGAPHRRRYDAASQSGLRRLPPCHPACQRLSRVFSPVRDFLTTPPP